MDQEKIALIEKEAKELYRVLNGLDIPIIEDRVKTIMQTMIDSCLVNPKHQSGPIEECLIQHMKALVENARLELRERIALRFERNNYLGLAQDIRNTDVNPLH
jgi:hypothetical protein